jgi:hypothetical protein
MGATPRGRADHGGGRRRPGPGAPWGRHSSPADRRGAVGRRAVRGVPRRQRGQLGSRSRSFGRLVRRALGDLGLDDRYVVVDPERLTPVTDTGDVLRDLPARRLPAVRPPPARGTRPPGPSGTLDRDPVYEARLFWATVTGPSEQPSRSAHRAAWDARRRRAHTVLVLDFRPMFWFSWQEADRTQRGQDPGLTARRLPARLGDGHGAAPWGPCGALFPRRAGRPGPRRRARMTR